MLYMNRGTDVSGNWLGFRLKTYNVPMNITEFPDRVRGVPDDFQTSSFFGSWNSQPMGIDTGDFDNDGDLDVFLTDGPTNMDGNWSDLYINTFAESNNHTLGFDLTDTLDGAGSVENNPNRTQGWGSTWVDFDNDGWLDLHVTTAGTQNAENGVNSANLGGFPDRFYLNMYDPNSPPTDGFTFLDVAEDFDLANRVREGVDEYLTPSEDPFCGPFPGEGNVEVQESRGNMFADFDNDGWIDSFVINQWRVNGCVTEPHSRLARNTMGENDFSHLPGLTVDTSTHNWIKLRLQGDPSTPNVTPNGTFASSLDGIGARVTVRSDLDGDGEIEPREVQIREVKSGLSNAASTSDLRVQFGLGKGTSGTVHIRWPSGRASCFEIGPLLNDPNATILECTNDGEPFACDACCPGDCNNDGTVDFSDMISMVSEFGTSARLGNRCDANRDGGVDFADLVDSLSRFGECQ